MLWPALNGKHTHARTHLVNNCSILFGNEIRKFFVATFYIASSDDAVHISVITNMKIDMDKLFRDVSLLS